MRERGSERARERGSERGSVRARERAREGARERESERASERVCVSMCACACARVHRLAPPAARLCPGPPAGYPACASGSAQQGERKDSSRPDGLICVCLRAVI